MADTHEIIINGVTITAARATNRRREESRKIYRIVAEKGMSIGTTEAYADIVAHTVAVKNGWQPPTSSAAREVILDAFEAFLDLDTDFTDQWHGGLFRKNTDPVTAPTPLPEGAPPNS